MMKALIRKAARHTDEDGIVDEALLKRILVDDGLGGGGPSPEAVREKEQALQAERQRAMDAEARLAEAQARLNALAAEKQRVSTTAEQARTEALEIKLSLEMLKNDVERRNKEMQLLEAEYDALDQHFAKVRAENHKLRLKEAHAAGREAAMKEAGVAPRAYDDAYKKGMTEGAQALADKLLKEFGIDEQKLNGLTDPAGKGHHRVESSGDTQAAPVSATFRGVSPAPETERPRRLNKPERSSSRAKDRDRQRSRSPTPVTTYGNIGTSKRGPSPAPNGASTTAAEQLVKDYRDPAHHPYRVQPSPRPFSMEPLDEVYVPTVGKDGHISIPSAYEFAEPSARGDVLGPSPTPSPRYAPAPLPSSIQVPELHMPPPPPPKTPRSKAASVRSRDGEYRSRSPNQSTPLSQFSILNDDDEPIPPPPQFPSRYHDNGSRDGGLSVIQEVSDTDGPSPVTRMNHMSPIRGNRHDNPSMPSYVPAHLESVMRNPSSSSMRMPKAQTVRITKPHDFISLTITITSSRVETRSRKIITWLGQTLTSLDSVNMTRSDVHPPIDPRLQRPLSAPTRLPSATTRLHRLCPSQ